MPLLSLKTAFHHTYVRLTLFPHNALIMEQLYKSAPLSTTTMLHSVNVFYWSKIVLKCTFCAFHTVRCIYSINEQVKNKQTASSLTYTLYKKHSCSIKRCILYKNIFIFYLLMGIMLTKVRVFM